MINSTLIYDFNHIDVMTDDMTKLDMIRRMAGEPYYSDKHVLLYNNMDCTQFMNMISEPSIDLTVTSPPYNIGKEYEKILTPDSYLKWCEKWLNQIFNITDPSGTFWLNLGYFEIPSKAKAVPINYLLWDKTDFYFM